MIASKILIYFQAVMPTLSFHLDKRYAVLAGNLSSNLVHQRWLSYVGSTWFNLFTISLSLSSVIIHWYAIFFYSHALPLRSKRNFSFALCFWLAFIRSLTYFFFLYRSSATLGKGLSPIKNLLNSSFLL